MTRAQKTTLAANERALEMAHPVAEQIPLTIHQNSATTHKNMEGAKLKSTAGTIDAKAATGEAFVIDSITTEVKEEARTRPVVTDRAADERGEQLAPHRRRPAMLSCVRERNIIGGHRATAIFLSSISSLISAFPALRDFFAALRSSRRVLSNDTLYVPQLPAVLRLHVLG
jgi:hypothetical protein